MAAIAEITDMTCWHVSLLRLCFYDSFSLWVHQINQFIRSIVIDQFFRLRLVPLVEVWRAFDRVWRPRRATFCWTVDEDDATNSMVVSEKQNEIRKGRNHFLKIRYHRPYPYLLMLVYQLLQWSLFLLMQQMVQQCSHGNFHCLECKFKIRKRTECHQFTVLLPSIVLTFVGVDAVNCEYANEPDVAEDGVSKCSMLDVSKSSPQSKKKKYLWKKCE